jgi:hypothetical protein
MPMEGKVGKNTERDNAILDRWAAGISALAIGSEFGLQDRNICGIVGHARNRGDERAINRKHHARTSYRAVRTERIIAAARINRMKRLAKKFPATDGDLAAAIAQSTVAITRLGIGAHLGWRPKWLR